MAIDDYWFKNAVIYCLNVATYMDCNGDGIGDFEGLSRRFDYLAALGVTCVWLQPFCCSPNRDNGYDISDYYGVTPRFGTSGDFVECMNTAQALGLRVVVDLVANHTSIDHPWFQAARADRKSPYRDWYVWADKRPRNHAQGTVFPPVQKTTWTRDRKAGQYYFHRFYDHQADLNTWNQAYREELYKIMGYWLQLGVSGFRMDAVPFLVEKKGANVKPAKDFALLQEMRRFLQWRARDAILLAEANVPANESMHYFGDEGDRLQMMLNFPVNQRLYYAFATHDPKPLKRALRDTIANIPRDAQWVQFLRSHDELDLGRLTEEQRAKVFQVFAPDATMQLYNRGIRRRLAPMLGNDRRRLELAYSLLFSLPGTPMIQYGDEIGMGEDLSLNEREATRTPMQWTGEPHGGFTSAKKSVLPVVDGGIFGYQKVNVNAQRRDPNSFMNWITRLIRVRKECMEISWGECEVIDCDADPVLVLVYRFRKAAMLSLHNFSDVAQSLHLKVRDKGGGRLIDLIGSEHSRAGPRGIHEIALDGYGYRWFRIGAVDETLSRAPY
ncbi:MAG TPA: alpha-amylase family protein [Burkholderiales bacterium]|nr:alpha-amylase family protein [Burkholderiales bacterium]